MGFSGRTTAQIYSEITNEINTMDNLISLVPQLDNEQDLLNNLKSGTKTAIWRLFARTIAWAIGVSERNLKGGLDEINDIIVNQKVQTREWYVQKSLEYQDGYTISKNETTFQVEYETEDESAKIIKNASLEDVGNRTVLKVRKETGALTTDEKTRFETYMNKIKALGSRIDIRSVDSDKLSIYLQVYYNGEVRLGDVQINVESAVEDYIKNLPFNSAFKVNTLLDTLRVIDGVDDVRFISATGVDVLANTTNITFDYTAYAGWCEISTSTPIADTITYTGKYN